MCKKYDFGVRFSVSVLGKKIILKKSINACKKWKCNKLVRELLIIMS